MSSILSMFLFTKDFIYFIFSFRRCFCHNFYSLFRWFFLVFISCYLVNRVLIFSNDPPLWKEVSVIVFPHLAFIDFILYTHVLIAANFLRIWVSYKLYEEICSSFTTHLPLFITYHTTTFFAMVTLLCIYFLRYNLNLVFYILLSQSKTLGSILIIQDASVIIFVLVP